MYLSRLKLIGFKSFAHKTKLDFNEGLSCIIGPNGSGKSNIVDAVRWVLGEQKVSALRSDKMENVIFNGTRTRKPMGMTEVSLTIQNNKNILKTEFEEVVVSRRLYRSGESQYLINKTPVRLKDIQDIFMDTGMGANSYSVIELKMVESILSENKQERRLLLDEAAGVVKYKVRRKSALRKLEATRVDLNRINDIISEVDKVVRSLSRQVGKARRYLAYTDELKKLEIDLARFRYHRFLEDIRPLQAQLNEISKIKEESHHQITIDEALLEDYKRELIQIEQDLQKINAALHELDASVAQIDQDEAVARTKIEEMKKAKKHYIEEINEFEQKIGLLKKNLEEYESELFHLKQAAEQAQDEYRHIESERSEELKEIQEQKHEIDALNIAFRNQLQLVADEKESLKQVELKLQFLKEQEETLNDEIIHADEHFSELEQQLIEQQSDKSALQKEISGLQESIKRLQNSIEKQKIEQTRIEEEKNKAVNELERLKTKRNFLNQILTSYEGHSNSTQFIMQQRGNIGGIKGTVAELLSTDKNYNMLVEIVLSNALNYIVVSSVSTAKGLIDLVRRENKGRITLVPLDRLSRLTIPDFEYPYEAEPLINHIKTRDEYKLLYKLLLGDVLITEGIDQALQLSEHYPAFRFITRNGEIVQENRQISGGSFRKKESSLIGRKDQLEQIEKAILEKQSSIDNLSSALSKHYNTLQNNLNLFEEQQDKIKELKDKLYHVEAVENQIKYEMSRHDEKKKQQREQLDEFGQSIQKLSQEKADLEAKVFKKQKELDELEKETIHKTNEFEQKNELLQTLNEEVQRAQLKASDMNNQVNNRNNDIQRLQNSIEEYEQTISRRKEEIEQIGQNTVKINENSRLNRLKKEKIWEERDSLENQRREIEDAYQQTKDKILQLEDQTKKYRKQHDSSMERSRALEIKINENKIKAEQLREMILKEYSEDIEIGIPYEGINEEENEDRIETLRMRIKNMGPVNPLAVQEYDKEKERLEFLTKQRDDLLKAEKSLLDTIDKINKTARKQFLDTFFAIKGNFEKVFKSFFEEGEGTLNLSEHDDPLESDIEISVRTKGKRLQTLSLLSGGEKTLTAISLLFAIYLVKPSPFCILDEVDAPLDDVNIKRFTEALKTFTDNTQFIVVTHNKRTMEAAETLYGVTMEEEGVSKLVSVKFS